MWVPWQQMEMGYQGPWGGSTKVYHNWGFVRFSDPISHFTDDKLGLRGQGHSQYLN